MTSTQQKKIRKSITDLLKTQNNYEKSDDILVDELMTWLEVADYSKSRVQSDPTDWQALTTTAMASKQIQSLMTKLNLTPQERVRGKKDDEVKQSVDLNSLLSQ